MTTVLAVRLYRLSLSLSGRLFRLALRVNREAVAVAMGHDTDDQLDAAVRAMVDLGEARRLARMPRSRSGL